MLPKSAAGAAGARWPPRRLRVAMRVMQGGHDVPSDKLVARYPRTLESLRRAIRELPHVLVFDNSDLGRPFRRVTCFQNGRASELSDGSRLVAAALSPTAGGAPSLARNASVSGCARIRRRLRVDHGKEGAPGRRSQVAQTPLVASHACAALARTKEPFPTFRRAISP